MEVETHRGIVLLDPVGEPIERRDHQLSVAWAFHDEYFIVSDNSLEDTGDTRHQFVKRYLY